MCSRLNFAIFAAAAIFCCLSNQVAAQDELKYIAAIAEYSDTISIENSTLRCFATPITDRHFVTAADCVRTSGSTKLAVLMEKLLSQTESLPKFLPVDTVFAHPSADSTKNNIAVVLVDGSFTSDFVAPRGYGKLDTNSTVHFLPLTGGITPIVVYNQTYCDPSKSGVFCSYFQTAVDPKCIAIRGTSLLCGGTSVRDNLCGLALIDNLISSCKMVNGVPALEFISIEDHVDWIKKVSAGSAIKVYIGLVITSVMYSVMNLW